MCAFIVVFFKKIVNNFSPQKVYLLEMVCKQAKNGRSRIENFSHFGTDSLRERKISNALALSVRKVSASMCPLICQFLIPFAIGSQS